MATSFNRGDLVVMDFDPSSGHEQTKRRPCLVVSPLDYNRRSSFIIVCPITSTNRGWPFDVSFDVGSVSGCIMVDQVKSLDSSSRNIAKVRGTARVPPAVLDEVLARLETLLLS
ncbi:MAG TPA: type II toxin-antitoxin system PemK/MazF family toxin [Fibrobacteria bacterium]|mgnify:CR=1 FL=1|nr:type II toxin-antitoxin system PemK/MazF family toxin [Fibrobacteria bacterium]